MSRVYLAKRVRKGTLALHLFGIPLDDLALDCVADLFERDRAGQFPQLRRYFASRNIDEMTDGELLSAMRRLVFGKVGEGLFRRYRDADPSLAKMIRNLRYAQRNDPSVVEMRHAGSAWFVFGGMPVQIGALPIMGSELLEARIMCALDGNTSLQALLSWTGRILTEHGDYVAAYPVVGLAMIVRSALQRLDDEPAATRVSMVDLHTRDIMKFLKNSVSTMRDHFFGTYVGHGKTSLTTYNAYFEATRDILFGLCVDERLADCSYYDHLRTYVTDLSYEHYREHHRVRLEYIVKQTRRRFLDDIGRNW